MPTSERTRLGLAIEKAGWPHQRLDALDRLRARDARLDLEPFVEHQLIGAVALLERGERLRSPPAFRAAAAPGRQRRRAVGHVGGRREIGRRPRRIAEPAVR